MLICAQREDMRIFKNKIFNKWAKGLLTDESLLVAANEIAAGNYDVALGKKVYKQRIALTNTGKSGGTRIIVAFQKGSNMFFIYGFEKAERANITKPEKNALQGLAKLYFAFSAEELNQEVKAKRLIEIKPK